MPVGGAQYFSSSGSENDTDSTQGNIDSDSEYDLESLINENESSDLDWENYPVPDSVDDLSSELLTPRGISMSPVPSVHVHDGYTPATPIYSPASPDYSPCMSPEPIEIDSTDSMTPSPSTSGIIATRDCDMFDLTNCDSDQDTEGEAEIISLVGEILNRGKLPVKIHGVFVFPQPMYVHNLTWNEHPFEPCGNHCVMPERTDKSIAKFYLTHSLCLKHRSSLTTMGPWIYLSNRVSTLPKLHKAPQIPHFLCHLYCKLEGDQRVKDCLVACQLLDTQGYFTLTVSVDLYMINNPLVLKTFVQIYNLNDHVDFGDKVQFYLGKDFMERVHEFHINH